MIQTSCSELLVDTRIVDPKIAFDRFSKLFNEVGWESSPSLSVELLKQVKSESKSSSGTPQEVVVYDKFGNRAWLEFGDNAYTTTGYRFDSQGNHGDDQCYPIFKVAIEKLNGSLKAYDGGSTEGYEEWKEKGKKKK